MKKSGLFIICILLANCLFAGVANIGELDDAAVFSFSIMSDNKGEAMNSSAFTDFYNWALPHSEWVFGLGDNLEGGSDTFDNFLGSDSYMRDKFYPNVGDGENQHYDGDQGTWGAGWEIFNEVNNFFNRSWVSFRPLSSDPDDRKVDYYAHFDNVKGSGFNVHLISLHYSDQYDGNMAGGDGFQEVTQAYCQSTLEAIEAGGKTDKDIVIVLAHTGSWQDSFDNNSAYREQLLCEVADFTCGASSHVFQRYDILNEYGGANSAVHYNSGQCLENATGSTHGYVELHVLDNPPRLVVQYIDCERRSSRQLARTGGLEKTGVADPFTSPLVKEINGPSYYITNWANLETTAAANDAEFVSWSGVPTYMDPGETAQVSITMKNTGTDTWTDATGRRLGSVGDDDTWTPGSTREAISGSVAPDANYTFTFNITAPATPGSYDFQWRMVQDGVEWFGDSTPAASIPVGLVAIDVTTTDDTEEQISTGDVAGSSDLEFMHADEGDPDRGDQIVGVRFPNVNVPSGVTVSDAYIQFTGDAASAGSGDAITLTIKGHDADNSGAFDESGNTFDLSGRTKTSASVNWSPAAWSAGVSGSAERTPNLSSIIQEIIDRGGWSSGNDMSIIISGTTGLGEAARRAESTAGVAGDAAVLHIEYGSGSTTTIPDVSFNTPSGNVTLTEGDDLAVIVNATDPDGITQVRLYKDGVKLARNEAAGPYEWNNPTQDDPELESLPAGTFVLTAEATDGVGDVGQTAQSITVTVNGNAPTVTGSTPANSATDVSTNTAQVVVNFSKPMNGSSVGSAASISGAGVSGLNYASGDGGSSITLNIAGSLTANETYTVTIGTGAQSTTGFNLVSQAQFSFTTESGGGPIVQETINVSVATGADDAEEYGSSNNVDIGSSDLELCDDAGLGDRLGQRVGLRFVADIPQGATITSAYLEFESKTAEAGACSLTIKGFDQDNTGSFNSNDTAQVSGPAKTSASAAWSPGTWAVGGTYQSADISSVVQEIVDRTGWSANNGMAFIIEGSGVRNARSRDSANTPPLLHVDYETGGGGGGGANLVQNPSFENGSASWSLGGSGTVVAGSAQDGSSMLRINTLGGGTTSQTIPIEIGKTYDISVWIDASSMTASNAVFDTSDKYDGAGQGQFVMYDPNGGWTQYSGSFTATNTSVTLRMFTSAAFAGTVYYDNISLTEQGAGVTVPNVVNQVQATAQGNITGAGLLVGNVTTAYHATVPSGSVISQNPIGGTSVANGSSVDLVVSLGVQMVSVPNVVGQAQATATGNITGAGLAVGNVTTEYNGSVPAGNVISQSPVGSTSVAIGSSVDLVVSLGVQMVSVPNVVGQAQATAEGNITGAGLVVGNVTTANHASVPAGDVISQNPVGSTSVAIGSSVDLVVSLGPVQISVPGVVDMTQAAAESSITSAGLTVGNVTTANHLTIVPGNVISQNPAGGTQVDDGSSVDLVVSLGPVGPPGYTYCVHENDNYAFLVPCDLAYGANGSFNYLYAQTGTVTFNNPTFGDPASGTPKAGFYKISELTGYDAWAAANGVGTGDVDDDGDGMDNLLEYALDGNPTNMVDDVDPVFTKVGGDFEYAYKQRNDDPNLTYTVEVCPDLSAGNWADSGTTAVPTGSAGAYDSVKHTIPAGSNQSYIRLKVENP